MPSDQELQELYRHIEKSEAAAMQQRQSSVGQQLGALLNQMPKAVYQGASVASTLPTPEGIRKRIAETKQLLVLLEDVHALLVQHPDLERLIGTLAKLGSL